VPAPAEDVAADEAPEAFGMLASNDPDERIIAAENLAKRIAEPDAPQRLDGLVRKDPDLKVRRAAFVLALALYLDGHRDLEPAIVWVLGNGPEIAALRAVDAYRAKGDDPRDLAGALRHDSVKVQIAALQALPVVAPRAPDGVTIDYRALIAPLLSEEQPETVRSEAERALAVLAP
jgi:hypothetical protein